MAKMRQLGHLSLALALCLAMFAQVASSAEIVANFVNLGITPSDGLQNEPGRNYTNSAQQLSYVSAANTADVYASPLDLDAKIQVSTTSDGTTTPSIAGFATTRRWQELSGPAASALLFADIYFKGDFAASVGSVASFTHILSFRASPEVPSGTSVLVMNGTANLGAVCIDIPGYPNTPGTLPPQCYEADGDDSLHRYHRSLERLSGRPRNTLRADVIAECNGGCRARR